MFVAVTVLRVGACLSSEEPVEAIGRVRAVEQVKWAMSTSARRQAGQMSPCRPGRLPEGRVMKIEFYNRL